MTTDNSNTLPHIAPTRQEAVERVMEGTRTPLDLFVYNHCPTRSPGQAEIFLNDLNKLLAYMLEGINDLPTDLSDMLSTIQEIKENNKAVKEELVRMQSDVAAIIAGQKATGDLLTDTLRYRELRKHHLDITVTGNGWVLIDINLHEESLDKFVDQIIKDSSEKA